MYDTNNLHVIRKNKAKGTLVNSLINLPENFVYLQTYACVISVETPLDIWSDIASDQISS